MTWADGSTTARTPAQLESSVRAYADSLTGALPTGTRGQWLRHNGTSFVSRGPNDRWIEDFGGVADGDRSGTGTDNGPALTAALASLDVNRAGTIRFGQGKYYFATAVTTNLLGVVIEGEGNPGNGAQFGTGVGSTQFIVKDGLTWLTFNTLGLQQTRGPVLRNFQLYPADGSTTGNGILAQAITGGIVEDVMCTNFIGGYGMKLDGLSGGANSQYWELRGYGGGGCLTGLHLKAANGCRVIGGYFEGNTTPLSLSKGIYVESGDSFRCYGTVVSGFETGIHIASPATDFELFGPRFEYCNTSLRIASRRTHLYGGTFDNNLLRPAGATSASVCIQLDPGAANCYLNPADMQAFGTALVDNTTDATNEWHLNYDATPRVNYPGRTTIPSTSNTSVGTIAYQSAPASGGFVGWICTATGTPDTWKTWGAIS